MDRAAQCSMSASPPEYRTTLDGRLRTCRTAISSNFKIVESSRPDGCRRMPMDIPAENKKGVVISASL